MSDILNKIVTGGKLTLEFDPDKKTITITTPNAHQIVILDEQDALQLQDRFGNQITLGAQGITISSTRDVSISAAGNINIESRGNCTVDAMNITHAAKVAFTAKANAAAEVSAAGQTSLKGAMVTLN